MVRCHRCQLEREPQKHDVRRFVQRRVISLRHGCLCSDARVLWSFRRIAEALDIGETQVIRIVQRWRARGFQIRDARQNRVVQPRPKKMDGRSLRKLLSPAELNRMRCMSLRERVEDIRREYNVTINYNTLRNYYRQAHIKFRTVDLHAVNKTLQAEKIRAEQKAFCLRIMRASATKAVFWLDETTTSLRKKVQKRTWTNGVDVSLPYQSWKDMNRTIIGVLGGRDEEVFFHSKVYERGRQE